MIRKQTKKPQLSVILITHCTDLSLVAWLCCTKKIMVQRQLHGKCNCNFLTGTCYYDFQLFSFILGLH